MKKTTLALVASALIIPSVLAHTFKNTDHAIEYRQKGFSLIAYNFGNMSAMLKGDIEYDAEVFAQRAANVAALSKLPHEGFIDGSDKGNTDALAKIWSNKADFDAKMTEFQNNAATLAQVAQVGDRNDIRKAFGNTGKSCKGCHDVYKKD